MTSESIRIFVYSALQTIQAEYLGYHCGSYSTGGTNTGDNSTRLATVKDTLQVTEW